MGVSVSPSYRPDSVPSSFKLVRHHCLFKFGATVQIKPFSNSVKAGRWLALRVVSLTSQEEALCNAVPIRGTATSGSTIAERCFPVPACGLGSEGVFGKGAHDGL